MSQHFTATVKITKTVNTPPSTNGRGYNDGATPASHEVTELASIVIREDELRDLIEKAYAHIALVAPQTETAGKRP